jgi:short-subunit dehydrogenase
LPFLRLDIPYSVILSSRKKDKLEQVASKCKGQTNAITQVSIVLYDASDPGATDATVDSAIAFTGGNIDILILNAGVYQTLPAMETPKETRDFITRVNYQAPVDLAHSLIDKGRWKERGYGQIVVVASVMAHGPHSLSSAYAASKASLKNYFHTLSTEEHPWLRIDVACPGATATSMWENVPGGNGSTTYTGEQMTPDRVAHLILMGLTGPYWLFYETWISKIDGLLWIFMAQYTPTMFHASVHLVGYVRKAVFEHENLDVVDMGVLGQKLLLLLLGKYP